MNNNEEFRNKLIYELSSELNLRFEEQQIVNDILNGVLSDYEFNRKSTDIVASDVSEKVIMYLQAMKFEGLKDNTLQNYFYFFRKFATQINKRVIDINVNDLRMFLFKECEDQKPSTVNTKTTYIQNFFSWMLEEEIIEKNPAKKLSHVKVPERLRHALKIEEIERLRLACVDERERVIIELLFSTGCRVEELTNVNVEHLDFSDNSLRVVGKGDKERIVLFNPKTKVHIENYLKLNDYKEGALIRTVRLPHNRIGVKGIRYAIKNIAQRAGFDKSIYPHLFRHTTATCAINNGASIVTVQKLLGHSSIETTRRYAKISMERIKYEYNQSLVI
ncbi:MAG: tyrosine-type recombinase/integrase [Sarcina sp.]